MSIDWLASRLNIQPARIQNGSGGHSDESAITMLDAYAALGMTHADPLVEHIGLAIHTTDAVHCGHAHRLLEREVRIMFEIGPWSSRRAVRSWCQAQIDKRLADPSELEALIESTCAQLPSRFAWRALVERIGTQICADCTGTGYIEGKVCKSCGSSGRIQVRELDTERATYCHIQYDTWRATWRDRYRQVDRLVLDKLLEFEQALDRRVG